MNKNSTGFQPQHQNQQPPPPLLHLFANPRQPGTGYNQPANTTGFQTNVVQINGQPLRIDIGANQIVNVRNCPRCCC